MKNRMKRDPGALERERFDLLVIGAGITGVCVARDAALRGLAVALIDRDDFGSATSANSLRIMHGGLRYLPHGDLRLMRRMVRERTHWLRVAPHLVQPLPFVMPTTGKLSRHKLVMATALTLNDLISHDRNRPLQPSRRLPRGRILTSQAFRELMPDYADASVTGGAMWHDAQVQNSERLLLAVLLSATSAGARVANYVAATGFLREGGRVCGVEATDGLTGAPLTIRAGLVVNCAGAWAEGLLEPLGLALREPRQTLSLAYNVVTRPIPAPAALGFPGGGEPDGGRPGTDGSTRTLFIVPWQGHSVIGTLHAPFAGDPAAFRPSAEHVDAALNAVNASLEGAGLTRDDVRHVQYGFLPAHPGERAEGWPKLIREGHIYDHGQLDGLPGLITVSGVKYTSSRWLAEKVIDLAAGRLGVQIRPCSTLTTAVAGGEIPDLESLVQGVVEERPAGLESDTIRRLVRLHGTGLRQLLAEVAETPALGLPLSTDTSTTVAEVLRAVRAEMAVRLADVVYRRTEVGAIGTPPTEAVEAASHVMAHELGWHEAQRQAEVAAVFESAAARRPVADEVTPGD